MRIIKTLTLVASLLAPQAAFTTDLTVSLEGIVEYDDNAFRTRRNEDEDVAAEVRALVPSCRVVSEEGERHTLAFTVRQRRPFLRFLRRYVETLEVVSPAGLVDELRGVARAVLARYRAASPSGSAP